MEMGGAGQGRELNLIRNTLSGWFGVLFLLLWVVFLRGGDAPPYVKTTRFSLMLFAVMFVAEAYILAQGNRGLLTAPMLRSFNAWRLLQKLVGLIVTVCCISIPYWLFPEYQGNFYDPYFNALHHYAPLWIAFFATSLIVDDLKSESAIDSYCLIGKACLTFNIRDIRSISPHLLKQHFLHWMVKIFFLPLMFIYLNNYMVNLKLDFSTTLATYDSFYTLTFFTDTAFAVVGYAFGNKLVDSHVRSTESTVFGWVIALMCYQPFWSLFGAHYISYGSSWTVLLKDSSPWLKAVWAALILCCECLYVWATIVFGTRFSNLTHRGIITVGPYYYLKHPAYTGKLCSYLLISVPWVNGLKDVVRWSLLIGVYYWRAQTEENHLRSVSDDYTVYERELNGRWQVAWRALQTLHSGDSSSSAGGGGGGAGSGGGSGSGSASGTGGGSDGQDCGVGDRASVNPLVSASPSGCDGAGKGARAVNGVRSSGDGADSDSDIDMDTDEDVDP